MKFLVGVKTKLVGRRIYLLRWIQDGLGLLLDKHVDQLLEVEIEGGAKEKIDSDR